MLVLHINPVSELMIRQRGNSVCVQRRRYHAWDLTSYTAASTQAFGQWVPNSATRDPHQVRREMHIRCAARCTSCAPRDAHQVRREMHIRCLARCTPGASRDASCAPRDAHQLFREMQGAPRKKNIFQNVKKYAEKTSSTYDSHRYLLFI